MNISHKARERVLKCVVIMAAILFYSNVWSKENAGVLPKPEDFQLSTAYILGAILGILYKAGIASAKHVSRKIFTWYAFFVPTLTAVVISIPGAIWILPALAEPSGNFVQDMLYAFVVAYFIHDNTAEGYKLHDYVKKKADAKAAAKKKEKEQTAQRTEQKNGKTKPSKK